MEELLNIFLSKHNLNFSDIKENKLTLSDEEQRCLKIITYMLCDVYDVSISKVEIILERGTSAIKRYIATVQEDFDINNSAEYGRLFDELLYIFEQGERDGIVIE